MHLFADFSSIRNGKFVVNRVIKHPSVDAPTSAGFAADQKLEFRKLWLVDLVERAYSGR